MNKFITASIVFLLLFPIIANAQSWKLKRYEASLGIGSVNFFGDIGGTEDISNALGFKDIQLQFTRPIISFGARYKITDNTSVKMNLSYGLMSGNDNGSRNDLRNFAFTSTIFEPSFQFEYYILSEAKRKSSMALFNHRGMINNFSNLYLYLFSGVGGAIFNPKPSEEFVLYFKDNFSKFGIVVPVGIGLKIPFSSDWSLGFEFGRRFTTTDYIDGYTSKFSKHNDTYYFGVFSAIYKIRSNRNGLPVLRRRGYVR